MPSAGIWIERVAAHHVGLLSGFRLWAPTAGPADRRSGRAVGWTNTERGVTVNRVTQAGAVTLASRMLKNARYRFSWRGVRPARRDEGAARRAVTEEATPSRRTPRRENHVTSIVLSLTLTVAAPSGAQQDVERENLADIREVNVVVEDLADDAEADGLTRRALLDAAERQLEERGVPLGNSRQAADLYINVATHLGSTGLYAYYARVSVQQLATIEGNQLRAVVDTWDMASLGAVGRGNLPQVEQVVTQLVDLFCDDYFQVNDPPR